MSGEERELLEDVILHLESVRDQYYGGIPASAIPEEPRREPAEVLYRGAVRPRLLFLVCRGAGDAGADRELLEAAIEMGLQRGMDEIGVLEAAITPGAGEQLRRELEERRPDVLTVLGEAGWKLLAASLGEAPRHELAERAGMSCLLTHSLEEMRADVQKKKDFWFDLKTIMVALEWSPR